MGFGIVHIGDDRTKGDTPTYTYDASGRIIRIQFVEFDNDATFGLAFKQLPSEGNGVWSWIVGGGTSTMQLTQNGGNVTLEAIAQAGYANLGSQENRWQQIFTEQGGIQTSDRAEKTDIHYLTDPAEAAADPHSDDGPGFDGSPALADEITYADIEDFVRNLSAATFAYKSGVKDGTVDPVAVQLGLIADDICDHKLYPYIGVTEETKSGTKRGLQPIPLAVAALAMCKRQAEQIDELTDRIAKLEATK